MIDIEDTNSDDNDGDNDDAVSPINSLKDSRHFYYSSDYYPGQNLKQDAWTTNLAVMTFVATTATAI